MKLYNLFEDIILEEKLKQQIISEGISINPVVDAIKGKYNVNISYLDSETNAVTTRYIQVYTLGKINGTGNIAIRAYQISGGSKRNNKNGWKIFLLDYIQSWTPTNMKWTHPVSDFDVNIPSYNQLGDKTFSSIIAQVDPATFTRQRSDITQGPNNNELKK